MRRRYLLATLVLLASVAAGAALGLWLLPPPEEPLPVPTAAASTSEPFALLPELPGPLNVLFLGSDVSYEGGKGAPTLDGNSDMMLLLRLDPAERAVWGLSIPRDTRAPIPGHGTFKINAANRYGGAKLAQQAVADLLQVSIDRYLRINTRAIVQLVDAIGGVDVQVSRAMDYEDRAAGLSIHFRPGKHHMDGKQAHAYVRFRHDELADIGRIQRQQEFMRAVAARLLTPRALLQLPSLLETLRGNLDTDLANHELLGIAGWARGLHSEDLHLVMLPGGASSLGGVSYWIPAPERVQRMLFRLRGLPWPESYGAGDPSGLRVVVADGLGRDRETEALLHRLRAAGYHVSYRGEASGPGVVIPMAKTRIIAQTGDEQAARALRELLGVGEVQVLSTGDLRSDLTVITGQDWLYLRQGEVAEEQRARASAVAIPDPARASPATVSP